MRFMLIRKADAKTEAGVLPTEPLMAAMGQYMEEMSKAGILLAGEGLLASSKGARVKFSAGKPRVIDGPFPETGQLIGGFCIIQVGSKQAAIDWVKRWPALDGDGNVEVEIRRVAEAEDFGPEFTKEMREAEDRLRAEAAARR
jgi:hypothetical protein